MCFGMTHWHPLASNSKLLTYAQSQSSSSYYSPPSNESSFYNPPFSNDYTGDQVDLTEVVNFVTGSPQFPVDNTFHRINDNATTVQPVTVRAHIDDTYLPGCRQPTSPGEWQCGSQRRQAPRKNGFACDFEGCNKAFNRNCELKSVFSTLRNWSLTNHT